MDGVDKYLFYFLRPTARDAWIVVLILAEPVIDPASMFD
jgi:hypothetical protein